jgi:processing peptidase subunit alpha
MIEGIDKVSPESIRRVANRIFGPNSGRKPTLVSMGREEVKNWEAEFPNYGIAG